MKDFEYILEKIFSDRKFSRSEGNALDKVLNAGAYGEHELALMRSRLFDFVKEQLVTKDQRDLIDCLEGVNKALLPPPSVQTMAEAHFSPGMECLEAINTQIRNARTSLDICVFTISDNRIVDNIEGAYERGVKVRIVTDDDKQYDKGNDIFRLKKFGIPVVTDSTPDHMHHKFAVVDNKIVICGSYNWTRSAATRNNEDIVILDNAQVVKGFINEFEQLWQEFS